MKNAGTWSFFDSSLQIYDFIDDFSDKILKFENHQNQKYGLLSLSSGKFIIPTEYDSIEELNEKPFAAIEKNNKYGLIDKTGKIVMPAEYDFAIVMEDEVLEWAAVGNEDTNTIILIDSMGVQYEYISEFSEGVVKIQNTHNKKFGIFVREGAMVPTEYDLIEELDKQGFAKIIKNGKYGLVDKNGKIILAAEYEAVEVSDKKGKLKAKKNGKWILIKDIKK